MQTYAAATTAEICTIMNWA